MDICGVWRIFGWMLRAVPVTVRNAVYDFVARVRHRLFARPAEGCPVIPARLRDRFILP